MTEAIDTAFAAVNKLMQACDATMDAIINDLPRDVTKALEARREMLQTAINSIGGQKIIETENTPQVRTAKLTAIEFAEALLAAANRDNDHNQDLALFWPREPQAVSQEVIGFLEQHNCANLTAIAKVASASVRPPASPKNVNPRGPDTQTPS
jgi:hypothetical protein